MDPTLLQALLQYGPAGLLAYLWLTERRDAAERDRRLAESHRALMQEREKLDALLAALESNTRAITTLELNHRRLTDLLGGSPSGGPPLGGPPVPGGPFRTPAVTPRPPPTPIPPPTP